jgi:sugar lactone lactonase YvrE
MGTTTSTAAVVSHAGAWIDPSAPQIKRLLYISYDTSPFDVDVFNYGNGKQVGTIAGFGLVDGMCVDAKGDVWITDFLNASAVEFAHGGKTPLQTLSAGPDPTGCSINPMNGDLAVANFGESSGFVQVFKLAKGTFSTRTRPRCVGTCRSRL